MSKIAMGFGISL